MSEPSQRDLEKLGEKIAEAKQEAQGPSIGEKPTSATRVGFELLGGVAVGAGLGIWLDKLFGTSPFLLIFCFIFGALGGGYNIYRLAVGKTLASKGSLRHKSRD